ncbi:MAG: PepSY domain-containing protein [Acidimicrobiia bacterium]|nr:PepSY domain-containing protein [Acidimicrobiia bacterium]
MKVILGVAAVAVAGAIPLSGVAGAAAGETETPITGSALERATQVALTHIGGGRVTATESGDEDSYYEVEVTRDDGTQVDVQLDESFSVVGSEEDGVGDESD